MDRQECQRRDVEHLMQRMEFMQKKLVSLHPEFQDNDRDDVPSDVGEISSPIQDHIVSSPEDSQYVPSPARPSPGIPKTVGGVSPSARIVPVCFSD